MSIFDPYPPYDWATAFNAQLAKFPPSKAVVGFQDAPVGSGSVNHLFKTFMEALKKLDTAYSDATITVPISPVMDGGWAILAGTPQRSELLGAYIPGSAPTSSGVVGRNINTLIPLNNSSGVVWTLTAVELHWQRNANGALDVKIRSRDFGDKGVWDDDTLLSFAPVTPAGGSTVSEAVSIPILATKEYMLRLDMETTVTPGDVEIYGAKVTFNRNGIA